MEKTNLLEITGQESGIIIYGDSVIVTNWATYGNGLPIMSPINTVMEWPENEPLNVDTEYYVEDIRDI